MRRCRGTQHAARIRVALLAAPHQGYTSGSGIWIRSRDSESTRAGAGTGPASQRTAEGDSAGCPTAQPVQAHPLCGVTQEHPRARVTRSQHPASQTQSVSNEAIPRHSLEATSGPEPRTAALTGSMLSSIGPSLTLIGPIFRVTQSNMRHPNHRLDPIRRTAWPIFPDRHNLGKSRNGGVRVRTRMLRITQSPGSPQPGFRQQRWHAGHDAGSDGVPLSRACC